MEDQAKAAPPTVVSIGYEGRSIDQLVSALAAERVAECIDVRLNAASRKPGFSKRALEEELNVAGIAYRHEPTLGNPRDNRVALRRKDPVARGRYLSHLRTWGAAAQESLVATARNHIVAVLCFERDHQECHRSCLLDEAAAQHQDLVILQR